jgi:hypothetical protein
VVGSLCIDLEIEELSLAVECTLYSKAAQSKLRSGCAMGCGASRATVKLRVDSYRDAESARTAGSTADRDVGREARRAQRTDGPPSLGTLQAKHTSLAEDWEMQKKLSRKPNREASTRALADSPLHRHKADSVR